MSTPTKIAVIGQGDRALSLVKFFNAAGAEATGLSLQTSTTTAALEVDEKAILAGADLVMAVTTPAVSARTAARVAQHVANGTVYADATPGTPEMKRHIAGFFEGDIYADVAVPRGRDELPSFEPAKISGKGARGALELLTPLGFNLQVVSDAPGVATACELLRGLFLKGIAGVIVDTLWAAEALGLQEAVFKEILNEFENSSANSVKAYLSDTAQHIKRQQIEMLDIVEMLSEAKYESTMLAGIEFNLGRILHSKKIPYSK